MNWIRNNPAVAGVGGVALLALLAWLAFGFFGIHTAFTDDKVAEGGPVFSSGAGASGLPSDEMTEELTDQMNEAMEDEPVMVEANEEPPMDEPSAEEPPAEEPESVPVEVSPQILTLAEGTFIDRSHPTVGFAEVLNDGSTQRFLRFEDFETDNGPDLNVYLSAGTAADGPSGEFDDDFIDLGDLKGNIGSQNYEIPPEVDLDRYSTVVIWCVRFGVAFGAADLAAA